MNKFEVEEKKRKNVEALYLVCEKELKEAEGKIELYEKILIKLGWNGKIDVVEADPELEKENKEYRTLCYGGKERVFEMIEKYSRIEKENQKLKERLVKDCWFRVHVAWERCPHAKENKKPCNAEECLRIEKALREEDGNDGNISCDA